MGHLRFNDYLKQIEQDYQFLLAAQFSLPKSRKKEQKKIQTTINQLKSLNAYIEAGRMRGSPELSLGLPDLSHADLEQLKVCHSYLDSRLKYLERVLKKLQPFVRFLSKIVGGKYFDFYLKFKLSALKNSMEKTTEQIHKDRYTDRQVELLTQFLDPQNNETAEILLDQTSQTEKLSQRIRDLRERIKFEDHQIQYFQNFHPNNSAKSTDELILEGFKDKLIKDNKRFSIEQRMETLKSFIKSGSF